MMELQKKAYAKINLSLDVLGKRPDGYHEVRMIMQQLELSDRIRVERTEKPGFRLVSSVPGLPTDEKNLMVRAARLMFDKFSLSGGLDMELEKNIPVAAGLAGGSSDAAAVICSVNELFGLGLSLGRLQEIGVLIGADVPYCILGGTALSEGIGERLTVLPPCPPCEVLLCKPPFGASTAEIYKAFDSLPSPFHPQVDAGVSALRKRNLRDLLPAVGNSLEEVTAGKLPVIPEIEKIMLEEGALAACMSGSGPTVFGLYEDEKAAGKAGERLKSLWSDCFTAVTSPRQESGF